MNQSIHLDRELLLNIIRDQRQYFSTKQHTISRDILTQFKQLLQSPQIVIITGLRRVGKSTLLAQIAHQYLSDNYYYLNFEDERLINFSLSDFNQVYEIFLQEYGDHKTFLFDEIQNIPRWELFVRRLHNQGYKFIITGSNASLLSKELGSRLTGRYIALELFPFSLSEFATYSKTKLPLKLDRLTTKTKIKLKTLTQQYLTIGGIPDYVKYHQTQFLSQLYSDVLHRDIATRYKIDNVKNLKELSFYLLSNTTTLISFNKLKNLLKIGSVNTVKSYIDYLRNSWLFFTLNKYAYSVKEQQIASKKIYCIDNGFISSLAFAFSANHNRLLENQVFLFLKQRYADIYYYKTKANHEVDFYVPSQNLFIQVSHNLDNPDTLKRETNSLIEAYQENIVSKPKLLLINLDTDKTLKLTSKNIPIKVIPLYKLLLSATI